MASRVKENKNPSKPLSTPKGHSSEHSKSASTRTTPSLSLWQSPVIEIWQRYFPHQQPKRRTTPSRRRRRERQILIMLAFFSISIGLWENFRQLWLQGNDFSATDVSNIISIGTILAAIGMLIVGKRVKMARLKQFMTITLAIRCINFLILALLNHTGWKLLIDLFSIVDIVTGSLFLISIYPLLTMVIKSNSMYSRRKLVEYLFRDVGILVGGIFIGQQLGNFVFDYNACLLLATAFLIVASVVMYRLDLTITETAPSGRPFSAVKYILKTKLQRIYMIYVFLSETSFSTALGLKMLMLTDSFGFSAGIATNYLLIIGLISDFLGIMALRHFTPKNDYLTLTLKFGIRFVVLSLAAISGSVFLCFVAFTWTILSSTAYENITDGYYVNLVDNRHQLKYNTIRHVVQNLGSALGTFLCGQMFGFGPSAVFGLAAFVVILQLGFSYYLIYFRTQKPPKPPKLQKTLKLQKQKT